MSGRSRWGAVCVLLVACVALVLTASVASAKAPTPLTRTVTDDFSSGGIQFVVAPTPPMVTADRYRIQLTSTSIGPHAYIAIGGLPDGITEARFIALLDGGQAPEGAFGAGDVFTAPGKFPHRANFDFTVPGQYGFFCPITTPDGTPHYKLGFVGLFDVVG